MVSQQILGLESSLDFFLHFQRQVSMYFLALGFRLKHFDSNSETYLDKVTVTNRITARGLSQNVSQCTSKFHVSSRKLGSRLSIPPRLGTIATTN